jgi:hypothetical protein
MTRRQVLTLGLAAAGVVAGHGAAYVLAYPVAAERLEHLARTGHRGFPLLAALGCVGAALALAAIFVRAARRERVLPKGRSLALAQVALFLGLELAERGLDAAAAATDPAVGIGLVLQVLLAAILVWLARGAAAVGTLVARTRPGRPPAPGPLPWSVRTVAPSAPDPVALGLRRAPPSASVA